MPEAATEALVAVTLSDRTLRTVLPIPLRRTLVSGAVLGVGFDVLFDGPGLGLSFPLFLGMLLAALALNPGRARAE